MSAQIVLTGATGNTGQIIAQKLAQRGVPFAAMVRSEANRVMLEAQGIATVRGDFDDPESLVRALEGAERAYLVCTPDERLVARETAFITAAKRAGVRHVVKCSAYAAGPEGPTGICRAHGRVADELAASGLDWTLLRPVGFMQTFTLPSWDLIEKAGVISFPAGDGGMPLIDYRDVAEAAAKVLTEPGHEGKAYDLTGPEVLTWDRIAETLSRVLGRPVTYLPGSDRELEMMVRLMGASAFTLEHAVSVVRLIRQNYYDKVDPSLAALGVRPTTFEEFLRDVVSGMTGGGNSFQPVDSLPVRLLGRLMPYVMRLRLWHHRRRNRG